MTEHLDELRDLLGTEPDATVEAGAVGPATPEDIMELEQQEYAEEMKLLEQGGYDYEGLGPFKSAMRSLRRRL